MSGCCLRRSRSSRRPTTTNVSISRSLLAWDGFSAAGSVTADALVTPANVEISGDATLHDATIGGDLVASGSLTIEGSLAVGGRESLVGEHEISMRAPYQAPAVGAPSRLSIAATHDLNVARCFGRRVTARNPVGSA